jgi:AmmeMemoRadiSam system protein B
MYPGDVATLRRLARAAVPKVEGDTTRTLGVVVPHGPFADVADVAGKTLGAGVVEEVVVVVAPNHAGRGPRAAICANGGLAVPGGVVAIDGALAESIRALGGLSETRLPFEEEHAIEVLLPLLLTARPNVTIVPILVQDLRPEAAARIGAAIADAVVGKGRGVTIVATSDLAHYVPRGEVDLFATPVLEAIASLDPEALGATTSQWERRRGAAVEMCGVHAVQVVLHALRALDAAPGVVVARGTSGDVEHESSTCVAYGGVAFAARTSRMSL